MKKIGLFYSTETVKTSKIAASITEAIGKEKIEIIPVEKAWSKDFEKYNNLILGTSTWFDGELPFYWDELVPEIESLKLLQKRVAIFGLGDQKSYPENFADGIGILAGIFTRCGAEIIGYTSTESYSFKQSGALKDGKFQGLVIDSENQDDLTEQRITNWVKQLKNEFY